MHVVCSLEVAGVLAGRRHPCIAHSLVHVHTGDTPPEQATQVVYTHSEAGVVLCILPLISTNSL